MESFIRKNRTTMKKQTSKEVLNLLAEFGTQEGKNIKE